MKNIAALILAMTLISFTACQSKKKTQSSSGGGSSTETAANSGEQKVKYRLVVSFISHASGIDGAKYEVVENYIKTHPKKPAFEVLPWGREGERDICMNLKEMNNSEQKAFVDEIKKLSQGSDRVFVNENTERVKKQ